MDDSFPQTDCEARTDREARSPSPPSSANYSTDTTTSPVKPAGPMGFFAAVGDSSSSAPSSSSPTSDGSFAPISRPSKMPLPDTVVAFDAELDIGEEDQAVEESSGPPGAWQILRRLVDLLNNRDGIQIDESMARSAIKAYALRNKALPQQQPSEQEELMRDLNRGLRHDRLDQMYGKDGEAKRLNQPRPGRAGSDPLPYVPTMEPTYSPSRR
ncbi:hypothetical protein CBS147332_6834 [Penicillium roqueforti]|nr:hypothetical protein CBS147332_6834 [Penicillium roqueforti]KAI3112084.1 hypothetical protein CBS147331_4638 [Penicillium roqueforti]